MSEEKKPTLELATAAEKVTFSTKRYTRIENVKKKFSRTVGVMFEANELLPTVGGRDILGLETMEQRVLRVVRSCMVGGGVMVAKSHVTGGWGKCAVYVEFYFAAPSEKKIISEEVAWTTVGFLDLPKGTPSLEALVETTIRSVLGDEVERVLATQREEQAQEFAARIARHCDAKARESVKFEERLAALREDVRVAREALLPSILAEIPERGSDGTADPRVIAAAKALAPEKVAKWSAPSRIFPSEV